MNFCKYTLALLVVFSTLLTGCGGGAFSWYPDPVTGLTADNLFLGQTATLHLTGNALNNAISITSDKCSSMNPGQIGSPNSRTATCVVTDTGAITFTVSSSSGHEVYRTTLTVPKPVTDIRAVGTLTFGQEAVFELVGTPQNSTLKISADKCTLTLDAVSTDATRKARCTLLSAGPIKFTVTDTPASVFSSAKTLFTKTITPDDPTDLQVSNLKYNQTTTLLVPTTAKSDIVTVTSDKCGTGTGVFTVAAATYDKARVVTCTISSTGSVTFTATVTSGSGSRSYQKTATVPQPQVTIKTSLGDFVVELNPTAAPKTAKNFLIHVTSFYANTLFHRVEGASATSSNYVVQAGGFTTGMVDKTTSVSSLELETSATSPKNLKYSIGMARKTLITSGTTQSYPNPSQFYVNLRDNPGFDYISSTNPGYPVFGKVVSGTDTIDKIAAQPTHSVTTYGAGNVANTYTNVPVDDITILSASQTQ